MLYINGVPIQIPMSQGAFTGQRNGHCPAYENAQAHHCSNRTANGGANGSERQYHFQPPPNFASFLENISKMAEGVASEIASEMADAVPDGSGHAECPLFSFMTSHGYPNFGGFGMSSKDSNEKGQSNPETMSKTEKWTQSVDCSGFETQHIIAKVSGNCVLVKARQETGCGENKDCREMSRRIAIPDDVIQDEVTCQFKDGKLFIEGPRKKNEGKVIDIKIADSSERGEKPEDKVSHNLETNPEPVKMADPAADQNDAEKAVTMNIVTSIGDKVVSDENVSLVPDADDDRPRNDTPAAVNMGFNESRDMYTIDVDMTGYDLADIKVICKGHDVTLRAKRTQEGSNGDQTSNEMFRRFVLPPEADVPRMSCHRTENGRMKLTAPVVKIIDIQGQNIPITMETD